jgi:hypothetical protein
MPWQQSNEPGQLAAADSEPLGYLNRTKWAPWECLLSFAAGLAQARALTARLPKCSAPYALNPKPYETGRTMGIHVRRTNSEEFHISSLSHLEGHRIDSLQEQSIPRRSLLCNNKTTAKHIIRDCVVTKCTLTAVHRDMQRVGSHHFRGHLGQNECV